MVPFTKGERIQSRTQQTGIKTRTQAEGEGEKAGVPQDPSSRQGSLFVCPVILNLCGDGDLDVEGAIVVIRDDMAVVVLVLALGVKNAALAVAVNLDALLANLTDGVGLIGVGVDIENRVGGVGGVRAGHPGGSSGRVGTGVRTRERTTSNERTANGENDAHGHGGGKNSSHTKYS